MPFGFLASIILPSVEGWSGGVMNGDDHTPVLSDSYSLDFYKAKQTTSYFVTRDWAHELYCVMEIDTSWFTQQTLHFAREARSH